MKRKIDPKSIPTKDLHQYLLGAVSPRPIALVSTIDENGQHNLAPYSFFNAFSSNPPIVCFSSNRRVANNTTKDTLHNIRESGECVISAVNYAIVRQMTITSIEFPSEVSEFSKSGLTPVPADIVKPPIVKESPVNMECKVMDIITLGEHGGAGHMIICEVLRMHIDEDVIDDRNRIDPHKIDLMGRMGRAFYVRASGSNVQPIVQSVTEITIGYDHLPEFIKMSNILTANDIAILSGLKRLPSDEEMDLFVGEHGARFSIVLQDSGLDKIHEFAKAWINEGKKEDACKLLMIYGK